MCKDREPGGISDCNGLAAAAAIEQLNGGSAQWFALVVRPRFEKAVARRLELKGYETLLPIYKKYRKYGTRSKSSELPLFPGYVCCRFDVQARLPILMTPGVIHVLGAGNMPIPISEMEISCLQTAIRARLSLQPFAFVNAGQRVRISSGVLAGMEGIVLKSKPGLRLILSVTLLQRSVMLEIDHDQICAGGRLEPDEDGQCIASAGGTFDPGKDARQPAGYAYEQ
jgi:transcription antitermination factor NusG